MYDSAMEADNLPLEIDLLVFNSAGTRMAVDAAGVECIMSTEQAGQLGVVSCTLDEILGYGRETSPAGQKVIIYKNRVEACGLKVDGLESIITVPVKTIQSMPEPFSGFAGLRFFWGVILHGNDIVLLIDLYRLEGLKSCKAAATA